MYHASAMDFNGLGGHLASGLVGQVGTLQGDSLKSFLQHIADIRHMATFMITGHELGGTWTYKNLSATLTVDTGSAPPATERWSARRTAQRHHEHRRPRWRSSPVSDPDGDPVKYCFTVATGPDAKSGVVVDSGCLDQSDSWTVPPGVLQRRCHLHVAVPTALQRQGHHNAPSLGRATSRSTSASATRGPAPE